MVKEFERKDLEIIHDRLVDVFNKSPFPKDKDLA